MFLLVVIRGYTLTSSSLIDSRFRAEINLMWSMFIEFDLALNLEIRSYYWRVTDDNDVGLYIACGNLSVEAKC